MSTEGVTQHLDILGYKGLMDALSGAMMAKESSPEIDCLEFYLGHARRSRGFKAFSTAMTGNPRLFKEFVKMSGEGRFLGFTDQGVYYYVGGETSGTWNLLGAYTGSVGRRMEAIQFLDQLIFTDGENPVQEYSSGAFAALGGLATIDLDAAKHLATFYSFVVLANTYEGSLWNPQRVRWCDAGQPTDWNSGLAGFSDLTDTPGAINGLRNMLDKLFAYKERGIYVGNYTKSTDVFSWSLVDPGPGVFAPGSLVEIGNIHYFLGYDNIYTYDGSTITPIGDAIGPRIFGPKAVFATEQLRNALGIYVARLLEYWVAIPSVGRWPTQIFRYHIPTATWWPRTTSFPIYCFGNSSDVQSLPWLALTETWANTTQTWEELAGSGSGDIRGVLAAGEGGEVNKLDWDTAIDGDEYTVAYSASPDFLFQQGTRVKQYDVECQGGGYITAYYSTDGGETYTELQTRKVPTTWGWIHWSIDKVLERCRLKLVLGDADQEIRKQTLSAIEKRR